MLCFVCETLGLTSSGAAVSRRHLFEEVRFEVKQQGDSLEGWDRYILTATVVESTLILILFMVGAPLLMFKVVRERRQHFNWATKQDAGSNGMKSISDLAILELSKDVSSSPSPEPTQPGGDEPDAQDVGTETRKQKRKRKKQEQAEKIKGEWRWKPRTHVEKTFSIFEWEERLEEQQKLGLPWLTKHKYLWKVLPGCCRRRCLTPSEDRHGWALRGSTRALQKELRREWQRGYDDYQRKQGENAGIDEIWMTATKDWIYWKVFTNFVEKYLLFAISSNILSAMVDSDCQSRFAAKFSVNHQSYFLDEGDLGSQSDGVGLPIEVSTGELGELGGLGVGGQNLLNTTTAGITDGTGAALAGVADLGTGVASGVVDVIGDDVCERITALGLFGCTCGMFVFALVSQPFVEAKEDRVDASVRFAGTVTAFALILVVYSAVEDWVALVLVVTVNAGTIAFVIWIINPGLMVKAAAAEIRTMLAKREAGQVKKVEQQNEYNRRLFKASKAGDTMQVMDIIQKYDETLDINWQLPEGDLAGWTAIHAAAAFGNLQVLRELLAFGLYDFCSELHEAEADPLLLAYKNGCSQVVALLEELGFEEPEPGLGMKELKSNINEILVDAGKHPERGATDLAWILQAGEDGYSGNEEEASRSASIGHATADAMNTLLLRREWAGLAEFMHATDTVTLELWETWVNMSVITSVAKTCRNIKMAHVQNGMLSARDLQTIAAGGRPFEQLAVVFHGAASVELAEGDLTQEMSVKELIQHHAHAATTFTVAGLSRFMKNAIRDDYEFCSSPFSTDHSRTPTQWKLTLNTRGANMMDVFLQYHGRVGVKAPPPSVQSSMIVTCSKLDLESVNTKRNLFVPVQVSTQRFAKGQDCLIATFDVSAAIRDNVEQVQIRLSEIFVMDPCLVKPGGFGTELIEWRLCGLPFMLPIEDTNEATLIPSQSVRTSDGQTWQLALHLAYATDGELENPPLEVDEDFFLERLLVKVKAAMAETKQTQKEWDKQQKKMKPGQTRRFDLQGGSLEIDCDGGIADLSDVSVGLLVDSIDEAIDSFAHSGAKQRHLKFSHKLSSKVRKYLHTEAERLGFLHRSVTSKETGDRNIWLEKPEEDEQGSKQVVDVYAASVGGDPVGNRSFALRVEEEPEDRDADRLVLAHHFIADGDFNNDSRSCGCNGLVKRHRFDGGDEVHWGGLVNYVVLQFDTRNHVHTPDASPAMVSSIQTALTEKGKRGWLLELIHDELRVRPLIAPQYTMPDETAEFLVEHSISVTKQKGEILTRAGDHANVFTIIRTGECKVTTEDASSDGIEHTYAAGRCLGNLVDFMYGCSIDHEHTSVVISDTCELYMIRRQDLQRTLCGPCPTPFPEPLSIDLWQSPADPGQVRWTLNNVSTLLSGRASLCSRSFVLPATRLCSWRLHLLPRIQEGSGQPSVFPVARTSADSKWKSGRLANDSSVQLGIFIGCERHGSMTKKQLDSSTWSLSLATNRGSSTVSEGGGSLQEGYPSMLERIADDELGWGVTVPVDWASLMQMGNWEVTCTLNLDKRAEPGLGISELAEESVFFAKGTMALAGLAASEVVEATAAIARPAALRGAKRGAVKKGREQREVDAWDLVETANPVADEEDGHEEPPQMDVDPTVGELGEAARGGAGAPAPVVAVPNGNADSV